MAGEHIKAILSSEEVADSSSAWVRETRRWFEFGLEMRGRMQSGRTRRGEGRDLEWIPSNQRSPEGPQ